MQFASSNDGYGPISVGYYQQHFSEQPPYFGYGFNNPTQNLVDEFEPNDPRLPATVIRNQDMVLGIRNTINLAGNATGFLNRKAAILKPAREKAGDQNIRKIRYADVLLMKAEAAANLGRSAEAIGLVNQIRQRARNATRPKGSTVGTLTYEPATVPAGTLPDLAAGLSGQSLLNAIWHERRVEFGRNLCATGTWCAPAATYHFAPRRARPLPEPHVATETSVNPMPLLPIPLNETQTYGLPQNPGY